MTEQVILIVQTILGIFLTAVILLQQKGSGLGAAFGGSGNIYTTKRGIDKVLYRATIIVSILFFGTGLAGVIL